MRLAPSLAVVPIVVALTVPPARAQAPACERVAAAADSIWSDIAERRMAAGMAIAVVRGRDTLLWRGYGLADIENDVPVRPEHIFELGSITKQFTSAALLKLVEQGRISLDSSITAYLPDYTLRGNAVPVRQLLDHTSGIRSYTSVPKLGTLVVRSVPRDTLVAIFRDEPFDFAPGTALLYDNSGYYLAGLVIEKAAGRKYEDVIRELLFEPLGLKATSCCDPQRIVKHRASGYDDRGSIVRAQHIDMALPLPGTYANRDRRRSITAAGDTLKPQLGGGRPTALVPRANGSFVAGQTILRFSNETGPAARVWMDGTGTVLPFDRQP